LLSFGAESFVFKSAIEQHKYQGIQKYNLAYFLQGHETWSLTLREEHKRRVFENRVLREILGPKRDETTWEWSRLHNKKPYDLYCSPNIFQVIK
jgi:hypothetical protein